MSTAVKIEEVPLKQKIRTRAYELGAAHRGLGGDNGVLFTVEEYP